MTQEPLKTKQVIALRVLLIVVFAGALACSEPEGTPPVLPAPERTTEPTILDTCFKPYPEGGYDHQIEPVDEGLRDHLRGLVHRDLLTPVAHWDLRTPMPQDATPEDVKITGFYRSDDNRIAAVADYGVDSVQVKVQVNRYCQLIYWYTGTYPGF